MRVWAMHAAMRLRGSAAAGELAEGGGEMRGHVPKQRTQEREARRARDAQLRLHVDCRCRAPAAVRANPV